MNDPSLSFIVADWAPPPYTVSNLKRYICNREQFHPSRARLYLSRRDRSPALDYTRVDLLSSALRPGSTPEKAIAIVIQLDKEGLGTACHPLPIAYRCKKGMEEMTQMIKAVMGATVHKKAKLAAKIRKRREQKAPAEEKERARGEEVSQNEPAKYGEALCSEPAKQDRKGSSRVLEPESAKECREVLQKEAGEERQVVEVTPAEEAIRAHTRSPSSSSHLSSETYDPETSPECCYFGFCNVKERTAEAYHC